MKRIAFFLLLLAACKPSLPSNFTCTSLAQCKYHGVEGVCQPTGACSFPDSLCLSGERYGQFSPASLRGACVTVVDGGSNDGDGGLGDCPSFATFCDNFETGDSSKWTSSDDDPGSTTTVDKMHAFSDLYALDATVPSASSSGNEANLQESITSQSTGTLAVRAYIYNFEPLINYDSILMFDDMSTGKSLIVDGDNDSHWSVTEYPGSGDTAHEYATNAATPNIGSWTCVELDCTLGQSVELYVDSVKIIDSTQVDTTASYNRVSVGITRADKAGYRVFVDDVVIANQHIGCE